MKTETEIVIQEGVIKKCTLPRLQGDTEGFREAVAGIKQNHQTAAHVLGAMYRSAQGICKSCPIARQCDNAFPAKVLVASFSIERNPIELTHQRELATLES